jgi:hypothetical protein
MPKILNLVMPFYLTLILNTSGLNYKNEARVSSEHLDRRMAITKVRHSSDLNLTPKVRSLVLALRYSTMMSSS